MRPGGEATRAEQPRRRRNRWLSATAASIGLLAVLCSCAPTRPTSGAPPHRLSALPALTVHTQLVPPADVAYHVDGATRHPEQPAAKIPAVAFDDSKALRFRIVGGYPIRTLQLGAFSRIDAHGLPADGGDQFDCLAASSVCTAQIRAGSVQAAVELPPSVRLVIVRQTSPLAGGGTLDVVWRFRTGSR